MAGNNNNSLYALINSGRIDLKPEEFDRAVYQKGANVIWEKSMLCSCLDFHSGQPDYTCPACNGKGFIYFDPTRIRAVVSGLGGDNQNIPIGLIDVGTAYMTVRSSDRVNFRDRITFTDMTTRYSQVVTYHDAEVELTYNAKDVISVRVLNTEIPKTEYELSEDGGKIVFNAGVFNDGDRFSVLITINPVYIVIDMPHDLRGTYVKFGNPEETWAELPKQLIIKREDLMPLKRGDTL